MIVTRKQACDFIKESLDNEIPLADEKLEAVILAVNSDLSVRDWLMGLPNRWDIQDGIELMNHIIANAPTEDLPPFITIQSSFYYELGDGGKANSLLNYATSIDPDYSLANLLMRVYHAGWPVESFQAMRDELDVKVVEECYGENGSTTITEDGELHAAL